MRLAPFALAPLVAAGVLAVVTPAPAAAAPPDLHVRNCTVNGDGAFEAPYCTIGAALAVVEPGQTVLVHPGVYPEAVTFPRSGTEAAPITVRAVNGPDGHVEVGPTGGGTAIDLTDVHDVVVDGLTTRPTTNVPPVYVNGSTRVTLDRVASTTFSAPGVQVFSSSDVTITRGWFSSAEFSGGIMVAATASGVVASTNTIRNGRLLVAAPGTLVTGNTVVTSCNLGVILTDGATGGAVRNNIVRTGGGPVNAPTRCSDPTKAAAITAPGGTTADYNLIDPLSGGPLYRWGGTDYTILDAFRSATGQGAHDIAAPAGLTPIETSPRSWFGLAPTSPAVDSADGSAPGATPTDLLDNPHADAPAVANTGSGGGYHDRGAVELQGPVTVVEDRFDRTGGLGTRATFTVHAAWPTDGPIGRAARRFDDEPLFVVGRSGSVDHRFRRGGQRCVQTVLSLDDFRALGAGQSSERCLVLGTIYTPTAPTRVLDSRNGTGIGSPRPINASSDFVVALPAANGVAARDMTAVVVNVTVTRPSTSGFVSLYPDGTPPLVSNVNFVAGETVANLVTVPVDGLGRFRVHYGGTGSAEVIADLQGFYSEAGQRYRPADPVRVLDTRREGGPIAPNADRLLDLSGRIPASATAVVVNLTAVGPTAAGLFKAWADGRPAPATSNLNFARGQTIPNLAIVPVAGGKLRIRNEGTGSTNAVVDLNGWFGADGTDLYVPYGPQRVHDSRASGAPVAPNATTVVDVPFFDPSGDDPRPTAVVANLTVTQPTAAGVLTAYPAGGVEPFVSNVNFVAGETAANHAIVRLSGDGELSVDNNSTGRSHVIVDQAGYFIGGPQ